MVNMCVCVCVCGLGVTVVECHMLIECLLDNKSPGEREEHGGNDELCWSELRAQREDGARAFKFSFFFTFTSSIQRQKSSTAQKFKNGNE